MYDDDFEDDDPGWVRPKNWSCPCCGCSNEPEAEDCCGCGYSWCNGDVDD
jgi:hypothetical protein